MDTISLDSLEDFDFEDATELADLIDSGFRRKRLSGADAAALVEADYNGFDPED